MDETIKAMVRDGHAATQMSYTMLSDVMRPVLQRCERRCVALLRNRGLTAPERRELQRTRDRLRQAIGYTRFPARLGKVAA